MREWILPVILFFGLTGWIVAQNPPIDYIETPPVIDQYLEDYREAKSLVGYLVNKQLETHCVYDSINLPYVENYTVVCVLENVFDGSRHLLAEIGADGRVDTIRLLILRDNSIVRDEAVLDPRIGDWWSVLVPNVERRPGEYRVYFRIEADGEVESTTARFTIQASEGAEG